MALKSQYVEICTFRPIPRYIFETVQVRPITFEPECEVIGTQLNRGSSDDLE